MSLKNRYFKVILEKSCLRNSNLWHGNFLLPHQKKNHYLKFYSKWIYELFILIIFWNKSKNRDNFIIFTITSLWNHILHPKDINVNTSFSIYAKISFNLETQSKMYHITVSKMPLFVALIIVLLLIRIHYIRPVLNVLEFLIVLYFTCTIISTLLFIIFWYDLVIKIQNKEQIYCCNWKLHKYLITHLCPKSTNIYYVQVTLLGNKHSAGKK